jgi:hypothetical protein
MNYLQDFITRVKADWQEWTLYQKIAWVERFKQRRAKRDVLRDQKMIDAALERARIKNAKNNMTYYIMKDKWGGINEINKYELDMLVRRKVFPKMNYMQRLQNSIAIVTSNQYKQKDFNRIQANKNKKQNNEQPHNAEDRR